MIISNKLKVIPSLSESHDQAQTITHNFKYLKHDKNYLLAFVLIIMTIIIIKTIQKSKEQNKIK